MAHLISRIGGRQMFAKCSSAAAAIAAVALCLCGSAAAHPEVPYIVAGNIAKYCAAPDQTMDNALCVWFVTGALEVIVNNRAYGRSVCPPHMINLAQAVRLTREWLDAHPDEGMRPASYAIATALAEAFPCEK
jgi:hypothetical protein